MTQFVFICGAGRSGTTLTRSLIDGHSRINTIPDELTEYLHVFFDTASGANTISLDTNIQPLVFLLTKTFESFDDHDQICKRVDARLDALRAEGVASLDPERFLDETCKAAFDNDNEVVVADIAHEHIGGYLRSFSNSRVLMLLRNPMEQMNSFYRFRGRDARSFGGAFPGTWEFGDAFYKVHRAFREAATYRTHEDMMVVRVEDLQREPAAEIGRIFEFLNLQPEEVNQSITQGGRTHDAGSTQRRSSQVFKPDHDTSCLTKNDIYYCSLMHYARDWYDLPETVFAPNSYLPFLLRQLGLTGKNRGRTLNPVRLFKVIIVSIAQYLQDLRSKRYFEHFTRFDKDPA